MVPHVSTEGHISLSGLLLRLAAEPSTALPTGASFGSVQSTMFPGRWRLSPRLRGKPGMPGKRKTRQATNKEPTDLPQAWLPVFSHQVSRVSLDMQLRIYRLSCLGVGLALPWFFLSILPFLSIGTGMFALLSVS